MQESFLFVSEFCVNELIIISDTSRPTQRTVKFHRSSNIVREFGDDRWL
jgi:hypothetical protein